MKRKEEEGDVKLKLNKSSTRGNVLTLALTLGTLISVLFLFVGGIIGWLYKEHKQRNDISEMHPEMYDLKGNVIPDEIIAFRFENLNFDSEIDEELFYSELLTGGIKDPELLIRTSGEKRISNFLLWQLAYSEIYISDVLWPDFNEFEFLKAIIDYQSRNRRFGGIESLPNESFEDSQYSS